MVLCRHPLNCVYILSTWSSIDTNLVDNIVFSVSQKTSDNKDVIESTSDLLPYMDKMLAHLRLLGTVLGIEDRTSAVVNGPGNFEEKCIDILSYWLEVTPHPTWTMFCDRLKRAKTFNSLRSKICSDKSC